MDRGSSPTFRVSPAHSLCTSKASSSSKLPDDSSDTISPATL